jgi:hypothetical protein
MGSSLAVPLEVGADVGGIESCSFADANRNEFAQPHEPIDAASRDAEDMGDVGDREEIL